MLDLLDYIEKVLGVELLDYQKELVRELENLPRDQKILLIYPPHIGRTYFHGLIETSKIIFGGGQNASHQN